MFNLLYKELRLAAHPTLFVFMLMGILVIVPAYPYGVVFLFGCLAPFITFMFGRETRDTYYTALLPIKKSDVVKGKCLLVSFTQLTQLLISIPFAILRVYIIPEGNPVGIEANVAYYGFGLIIFAIFNLIFFVQFYQTAFKVGQTFIIASVPAVIGIFIMEFLAHIPSLQWLDSTSPDMMFRQLPILGLGLVIYIMGMCYTFNLAARRFSAVDL